MTDSKTEFDLIWEEFGKDGLKLPQSADAMLWARALAAGIRKDPSIGEEDCLVGWFANAKQAAEWRTERARKDQVSELEPELRGAFERILNVARCLEARTVGNIELADRLIKAYRGWSGR